MEASTSTNCCDRLCSWFYSLWQGAVRFVESNEEVIRKRRRLALGVIVLLIVDVLWVGSAELSDVSLRKILSSIFFLCGAHFFM